MTNKPMLSVGRNPLGLSAEAYNVMLGMVEHCLNIRACMGMDEGFKDFDTEEEHDFVKELRALLNKPELCGTHTGDSCSYCGGSGLKGFQCQSDPVAEVQHGPFDDVGHPQWVRVVTLGDFDLEHIPDGTKLFMAPAEQPAPVAVVMPELKTPYYKVVPTKFGNKEGFWQITPDSSIVYDNRDEAQARADARNASRAQHFFDSLKPCLEEVARLNGVKP